MQYTINARRSPPHTTLIERLVVQHLHATVAGKHDTQHEPHHLLQPRMVLLKPVYMFLVESLVRLKNHMLSQSGQKQKKSLLALVCILDTIRNSKEGKWKEVISSL